MAFFPAIDVTFNNTIVFQIESIMLAYCFTRKSGRTGNLTPSVTQ
jgi:hypothetical protein